MMKTAEMLGRLLRRSEDVLLVALLAAMLLLAASQIVLRNAMGTGLIWADELLRIQVLWIGLLGAVIASRDRHHITIDLLSRYLPPRLRTAAAAVVDLFTAFVCGLVAWHAGRFVRTEVEFGATALGSLPACLFEAVIPAGFALIGLRYLLGAFRRSQGEAGGVVTS